MQLNLQPDLQRYIEDQVEGGFFPTPEAVVEAALRDRMALPELSDEELAAIDRADDEIDRTGGISMEDVRKHFGLS